MTDYFSIFSTFEQAQIVFNVTMLVAVVWCVWKLRGYRRMVQLMTADSSKVPTDAELVKEWAQQYAVLPKGSPKWKAYRNRLIELGVVKEEKV